MTSMNHDVTTASSDAAGIGGRSASANTNENPSRTANGRSRWRATTTTSSEFGSTGNSGRLTVSPASSLPAASSGSGLTSSASVCAGAHAW